jgi:hypothetical protein
MREVTPKELQKLNDKSFKDTQKLFRRRLREIAEGGKDEAEFDKGRFIHEQKIIDWLQGLGFTVKEGTSKYYITWPFDLADLYDRVWSGTVKWRFIEIKRDEEGTWIFDPHPYDYVCSECGKHSEYTSPYCPHCGKKLKPIEGRNYDKE